MISRRTKIFSKRPIFKRIIPFDSHGSSGGSRERQGAVATLKPKMACFYVKPKLNSKPKIKLKPKLKPRLKPKLI